MATDAAQETYSKQRHPGERPFAVIKQTFGARQFLLRGLENVTTEWRWLTISFNIKRLIEGFGEKLFPRPGPEPAD